MSKKFKNNCITAYKKIDSDRIWKKKKKLGKNNTVGLQNL